MSSLSFLLWCVEFCRWGRRARGVLLFLVSLDSLLLHHRVDKRNGYTSCWCVILAVRTSDCSHISCLQFQVLQNRTSEFTATAVDEASVRWQFCEGCLQSKSLFKPQDRFLLPLRSRCWKDCQRDCPYFESPKKKVVAQS